VKLTICMKMASMLLLVGTMVIVVGVGTLGIGSVRQQADSISKSPRSCSKNAAAIGREKRSKLLARIRCPSWGLRQLSLVLARAAVVPVSLP
jgi:hypothetical protein